MSLRTDTKRATADALDEAMSELIEPGAVAAILCATSHHARDFPEILNMIRSRTHVKALLGATGSGVVGPRGEVENMPALSILLISSDRVHAGAALIPRIDVPDAVDHLRGELPSLYRERGALFLMIDPKSAHPEFIHRLSRTFSETPVVGAAAGWCSDDQSATIAADGFSAPHGCAAMHISGCIEPAIGVAQAVLPESVPRPITQAKGNVIEQIDSEPAAHVLGDFVQSLRNTSTGSSSDVFCCLAESPADFDAGRYIVRNFLAVEPGTKNITVAEYVRPDLFVAFGRRSAKGARRSFRRMLERLNASFSSCVPRAAVIFNCCARGQTLYGRPHVDIDAYHEFFPDLPLVGLFGFSEIGPIFRDGRKVRSGILNHTAVLTVITEPMEALGTT